MMVSWDYMAGQYSYNSLQGIGYIFWGKNYKQTSYALSTLSTTDGIHIYGSGGNRVFALSAREVGDVNGDGIQDIGLSSIWYSYNGPNAGSVYVIFGNSSRNADIQTSSFSSLNIGYQIIETQPFSTLGNALSAAGDFNGDGIDDVLSCAPYVSNGPDSRGRGYITFGSKNNTSPVYTGTSMSPAVGFMITGDGEGAGGDFCNSCTNISDFNGDGLADILITSRFKTGSAGSNSGRVYIIYGQSSPSNLEVASMTSSQGFTIDGANSGDLLGNGQPFACDFNNDGKIDILIGTPECI